MGIGGYQSQFPASLYIQSKHPEQNPPWKHVRIRMTLVDAARAILADKIVRPKAQPNLRFRRETPLNLDYKRIDEAGRPRNYRLIITVITPSRGKGDRAFFGTYAHEIEQR
ncbi:MAG: hypothetical protein M3463_22330 [Verrucomicrobiota bacterium]|nr:hypothetical protein [Verrucomicrobiota bacterium]